MKPVRTRPGPWLVGQAFFLQAVRQVSGKGEMYKDWRENSTRVVGRRGIYMLTVRSLHFAFFLTANVSLHECLFPEHPESSRWGRKSLTWLLLARVHGTFFPFTSTTHSSQLSSPRKPQGPEPCYNSNSL